MDETFGARISRAWNAFMTRTEQFARSVYETGISYSSRPDRSRFSGGNNRSIIAAVYNRMSLDVASMRFQHVRVDENKRYVGDMDTGLNDCLNFSANIDQTGTAFIQDAAMSLFDEGSIAIVPVDTTRDPSSSDAYDVNSLRVGKIKQWYPRAVRVEVYNDHSGNREEITLPKWSVAIVENPLYAIMNEPNSTLKRLVSKLNMLDAVDEQSSSGKLDLIIQLPYMIKSDARKQQAEDRRTAIEEQLRGSQYGIAYTDGTEKIIQLNRPTENNLQAQVEYLTSMLYSQLGLTTSVMDGSADEATMLNYYKRTVEPITNAIAEAMARTFISKTARTQGQALMTFSDPFKLVPMAVVVEMADKFTRNEVMTSNEVRGVIGLKPSKQKSADELRNKNLNPPVPVPDPTPPVVPDPVLVPPETPKGGSNVDEGKA